MAARSVDYVPRSAVICRRCRRQRATYEDDLRHDGEFEDRDCPSQGHGGPCWCRDLCWESDGSCADDVAARATFLVVRRGTRLGLWPAQGQPWEGQPPRTATALSALLADMRGMCPGAKVEVTVRFIIPDRGQ